MPKSTIVASDHWPYYEGEPVYYDRQTMTHFTLDDNDKPQPTCNPVAADYAKVYNPDGTRKDPR